MGDKSTVSKLELIVAVALHQEIYESTKIQSIKNSCSVAKESNNVLFHPKKCELTPEALSWKNLLDLLKLQLN